MNKKRNYFAELAAGSVILSVLDRFAAWVYRCLAEGLFGRIFTAYRPELLPAAAGEGGTEASHGLTASLFLSPFLKNWVRRFRRSLASGVESSFLVNSILRLSAYLRGCTLKFYGFMLLSFGMYSGIVYLFKVYILSTETNFMDLAVAVATILLSLPLILSNKTLAQAVLEGKISSFLFVRFLGFRPDVIRHEKKPYGRVNIAFILGILPGVASFLISPLYLLAAVMGLFGVYLILVSPEIGVLLVFLTLPFLPTMVLVGMLACISICYVLKLLRGKRTFRFETVDIAVLSFMAMILLGGVFSVSRSTSLKSALVFLCFMLGYFLTVNLIRSRQWLNRCVGAITAAAVVESLIGIAQYLFGELETKWLDTEMFSDISGRITATLDNPNVLAEYIIMTLPIVVGVLFAAKGFKRKSAALLLCGSMGVALLLTLSRGAWVGIMFGAVLFIMIYHRRSIYLFVAGAAAVPFLPFLLPDTILARFSSIGDMADSSTSYRVYIWRASVNMIEDYFAGGIGIGEGAFRTIYPRYSYAGIEAAPHSHNLYLQIWLELGIFGLLVFAAFLFLLLQNHFTFCRDLSARRDRCHTDRVVSCACMCGLAAVLVQGMTDYIWYNYRVFLMFWLVAGLAMAYMRVGRGELETLAIDYQATPDSVDAEIKLGN